MKPVTTDPNTLANIVTGLGGTVIPGRTFKFELPLSEVRRVVPEINNLGLRVRNVSERVGDHPTQINRQCSFATLELYQQPEDQSDTSLSALVLSRMRP